ncbi:MAG: 5'/3'-nucleotidase SurE [Cyanobacteriota bacterium]
MRSDPSADGALAPLRILISNDDGVFAAGIRTLANAAVARGHQVTVVCPDQERAATGHGLTLQTPTRCRNRAHRCRDWGRG